MQKRMILAAFASAMLVSPALARDGSWYVGGHFGAAKVLDQKYDLRAAGGTAAGGSRLSIDPRYGVDGDGVIGYDFGSFRIEAEGGYKRAEVELVRMPGGTFCARVGCSPAGLEPAGKYKGFGNTQVISAMVNALVEFGGDDATQAFAGVGAGGAQVRAGINRTSNQVLLLDDKDKSFAWQAIAGVRSPLTGRIDVSVKYRFFDVENVKFRAGNGSAAEGHYRSHSVLAGLAFNFGSAAKPAMPAEPVAPPPPPPAPPAPPPAAPIETPGPFVVFFDWDRSNITSEAAAILDNAARSYAVTGEASIMLAGHADRSGPDRYNVRLSQRRADAVKAYLGGRGVPTTAITTEALGESRPLVQTADGVREAQNRRVEILFGLGSGQ